MAEGQHGKLRVAARGLARRVPTIWAAWTAAYWLVAAGFAALAAYLRYEQYSREARFDGLPPARSFLLQVAREAALFRAVEAVTLAALVFAALAVAVTAWRRTRRGLMARGSREERR